MQHRSSVIFASLRNCSRLATLLAFGILSACGSGPPRASDGKWSLSRQADDDPYVFKGAFRFQGGQEGWFTPRLSLLGDDGCERFESIQSIQPYKFSNPENFRATFDQEIEQRGPFAGIKLTVIYRPSSAAPGDSYAETEVFTDTKNIDPSVEQRPLLECVEIERAKGGDRKKVMGEMAETDPDRADHEAIDGMGRNELVATAINTAGHLCARVLSLRPRGDDLMVECVEYRSGNGRVRYRVNPSAGTVEPQ